MKTTHTLLTLLLSSLLLVPIMAHAVEGEVAIGGESLFIIRATVKGQTPDQRADTVTDRLPVILGDPNIRPSDIRVVRSMRNEFKIMVKQWMLVTVTPADGKINGITARKQAEIWAVSARRVLPMVNAKPNENDASTVNTTPNGNDAAATMSVSGTVTYFQRIALPKDAVLTVKIVDVTTANRPSPVIAANTSKISHQVPIAFKLAFDPGKIDSEHRYVLDAVIKSHGRSIWHSAAANAVITNGNPMEMQVMLAPVGQHFRK